MSEILITESGVHLSSKGRFVSPEIATGVTALLECSDYYLAHPPQQPKAEIAKYVESQGFCVPKKFASYDEAVGSGKKFIIRSEHPQDYAGTSDILSSFIIDPSKVGYVYEDESDFYGKLFYDEKIEDHCRAHKIDKDIFIASVSFSYWKYIEGDNYTVVGDDAIENKFHIYGPHPSGEKYKSRYISIQDGVVIKDSSEGSPMGNITDLVQNYTEINNLNRFDENHKPIMEFQLTDKQKTYFLQYHRCRDMNYFPSFTLERELEEGEIEASFVRGRTSQEGIIINMINNPYGGFYWDTGGVNGGSQRGVAYSKNFIIQFHMQSNFHQISNLHFAVSINHKTELYVGIPGDEILGGDKNWIRLFNAMRMCNTPTIYKIPVRFISDGKRAYIKPLVTGGEILECAKKLGIDILKYV